MVKKKFAGILSMVTFMLFSLVGCSSDPIAKIEVLNNTLKTEYVVGEEVDIDDFSLKITTKSNRTKVYEIEEDMVTLSEVDNTILGNQSMAVTVDYEGMEFAFVVSVNFGLPEDVKLVMTLINELPESKKTSFANETQIQLIAEKYEELSEFHKLYVINYNKYLESARYLQALTNKYITPEFVNERFVLKTNVDNTLYALNEYEYDEEEWEEVLKIYDNCIRKLYLNENHESINKIANVAIREMNNVLTRKEKEVSELKNERIEDVNEYLNTFNSEDYSNNNYTLLDNIVEEFNNKIVSLDNVSDIEALFNETIRELENVETLSEEEISTLNNIKTVKLNLVKNMLVDLDISRYNIANKTLIVSYYNDCLANIRNSNSEEEIDNYINQFVVEASRISTIEEDRLVQVIETKKEAIEDITYRYESINLHEYDSKNKKTIIEGYEKAIEELGAATTIEEIDNARSNFILIATQTPTILEEAISNLHIIIENAIKEVDAYITSLNIADYTEENWKLISQYTLEVKNYFSESITVTTSNVHIEKEIADFKTKIMNVMTIEAQRIKDLNETKANALKAINEYEKTLTTYMFENGIYELVVERINSCKNNINGLESIEGINKLVNDTIQAIEEAKK